MPADLTPIAVGTAWTHTRSGSSYRVVLLVQVHVGPQQWAPGVLYHGVDGMPYVRTEADFREAFAQYGSPL